MGTDTITPFIIPKGPCVLVHRQDWNPEFCCNQPNKTRIKISFSSVVTSIAGRQLQIVQLPSTSNSEVDSQIYMVQSIKIKGVANSITCNAVHIYIIHLMLSEAVARDLCHVYISPSVGKMHPKHKKYAGGSTFSPFASNQPVRFYSTKSSNLQQTHYQDTKHQDGVNLPPLTLTFAGFCCRLM